MLKIKITNVRGINETLQNIQFVNSESVRDLQEIIQDKFFDYKIAIIDTEAVNVQHLQKEIAELKEKLNKRK